MISSYSELKKDDQCSLIHEDEILYKNIKRDQFSLIREIFL